MVLLYYMYIGVDLGNGSTFVKVGRGGYSQTDSAPTVSVVREPRRTIEVEEGTFPPLLLRLSPRPCSWTVRSLSSTTKSTTETETTSTSTTTTATAVSPLLLSQHLSRVGSLLPREPTEVLCQPICCDCFRNLACTTRNITSNTWINLGHFSPTVWTIYTKCAIIYSSLSFLLAVFKVSLIFFIIYFIYLFLTVLIYFIIIQ